MHISNKGLELIEQFEGWSSRPYWDSYGKVWTRGYGETENISSNSPAISRAQGQANLKRLIEQRYEWAIRDLGVSFSQNEWDALCSFVWNLGAGIFTGSLRSNLQARHFTAAAAEMLQYDHAGGVVLLGLERRRKEEVRLFLQSSPTLPAFVAGDELNWCREWDHIIARRTLPAHLRRLFLRGKMRARMSELRKKAAHTGWGVLNRTARYNALRKRAY
jgi:lysozyme